MSSSRSDTAPRLRRPNPTVAAFLIGLPLAAAILAFVRFGPLRHTDAIRYIEHPVEWVEVAMFCCALGALAAKLWQTRIELDACRTPMLPRWDGKLVPVEEAPTLLAALRKLPTSLQSTYVGRRINAILEFLCQRRCANELDDQMRCLADNDAMTVEHSYSLVRFITWAIPILGFLGTVLGITDAISGCDPKTLAEDLGKVTGGLSEAFDCTALALSLTMITMFCSFLVERQEQGVLEGVDLHVDRQLAHRFQRSGSVTEPFVEAMRLNSQAIMETLDSVVGRQAKLWADAMGDPEQRLATASARQQEAISVAMTRALEQTLQAHAQRLAALEEKSAHATAQLLQQMAGLAAAVRDTGREQQGALMRVAESITGQAAVLGKLQDGEKDLIHLQAVLHQNLAALASASNFEQAVHSLTAAAHLLTARTAGHVPPAAQPAVQLARPHPAKAA